MATVSEAQTRLAEIEPILAAGVSTVRHESGRTVEYDLQALERERDRLQRIVSAAAVPEANSGFRRVVFRAR